MHIILKRIAVAVAIIVPSLLVLVLKLPEFRPAPQQTATTPGTAAIGGPFTLTDTAGNVVTEAALKGRYSLIYFGFTYCPDICPLTLQTMSKALEMAGPAGGNVLPVFITIDPERDTAAVLAAYMTSFHPRFFALTGSPEQIMQAEESYRVYAAKAPLKDAQGNATSDYTMDHTGLVYLMDPTGHYVTHFTADTTAMDMAEKLRRELSPP